VELTHQAGWTIPPPAKVRRAVSELVEQVESHLPQRFYRGEGLGRIYTAALVTRMADAVEAIVAVMDADLPIDGLILLRSLYEQAVVLCWLAIDFDTNIPRWVAGANAWDLRLHNDALPYDVVFLSDEEIAAMGKPTPRPDLGQLASEVDRHWGERIVGFAAPVKGREGITSFRGLYVALYRVASRAVHGQPQVLDAYGDFRAYPKRIERTSTPASIYWPLCVPLYTQALLVCYEVLGWPEPNAVRAINNTMYDSAGL
jgi:hypothetical protein